VTLVEAIAELSTLAAAAVYPELTEQELTGIVESVAIVDTDGYAPADAAWAGVYDLRRAAVKAWRLKAGKASANVDFANAAGRVNDQQVVTNCLRMANEYNRGVYGSLTPHAATYLDGVAL
jgi:hypothetical protein